MVSESAVRTVLQAAGLGELLVAQTDEWRVGIGGPHDLVSAACGVLSQAGLACVEWTGPGILASVSAVSRETERIIHLDQVAQCAEECRAEAANERALYGPW